MTFFLPRTGLRGSKQLPCLMPSLREPRTHVCIPRPFLLHFCFSQAYGECLGRHRKTKAQENIWLKLPTKAADKSRVHLCVSVASDSSALPPTATHTGKTEATGPCLYHRENPLPGNHLSPWEHKVSFFRADAAHPMSQYSCGNCKLSEVTSVLQYQPHMFSDGGGKWTHTIIFSTLLPFFSQKGQEVHMHLSLGENVIRF